MGTSNPTRSTSAFTDGLRTLADVLDQAGYEERLGYQHLIPVTSREEMLALTRQIGGQWKKDEDPGAYFGLTRDLGDEVSIRVYTARENVCKAVPVGKRTVTRFAPDAPTVEVEEDVVKWVCPPSLLAEARS